MDIDTGKLDARNYYYVIVKIFLNFPNRVWSAKKQSNLNI